MWNITEYSPIGRAVIFRRYDDLLVLLLFLQFGQQANDDDENASIVIKDSWMVIWFIFNFFKSYIIEKNDKRDDVCSDVACKSI